MRPWRRWLVLGLGLALACSPETPTAPGALPLPRSDFSSVSSVQGKFAFVGNLTGEFAIWVMNADGSGLSQVSPTEPSPDDFDPSWSPDGSKVAYSRLPLDGPAFGYDIFVMNADGSARTNLTNHPADDREPAWSADGSKIAFRSSRDGHAGIYVMNADGSAVSRLTNAGDQQPSWSPDGTKLAFESDRDGNGEIYVMNADGSGQTRLTHSVGWDVEPDWSPDGSKIAFASARDGNGDPALYVAEIYVMNADGSAPTRLTNSTGEDSYPSWSPDGTKIAFWSANGGPYGISVMNADGSNQTVIPILGNSFSPDWAPGQVVLAPGVTPLGFNVSVEPIDPATGTTPVQLTFNTVDGSGTTTVTSSAQGDPPPVGFQLGDPPVYYELTTTAGGFSSVTVCFSYDPTAFQDPAKLKLFHGVDGAWTDVTTSHDQANHILCGTTTSLSPFMLAEVLHYDFTGFFQPVDNGNVLNSVKAGSSIPVKFSLGGNLGLDVLTLQPGVGTISCNLIPVIDVVELTTTNTPGLTYDAAANKYIYVWKTKPEWKGTCRKFMLDLKDGTQHIALFQFK
jgi:Tol biopolymer transport system component